MDPDKIETSHDLADFLGEVAETLRHLPSVKLAEFREDAAGNVAGSVRDRRRKQSRSDAELEVLASQLGQLDRSEAETRLSSLTVESIRKIAPMLNIRIPSRAKKDESIEMLLLHLFDAPAGQELIRTFHKRYGKAGRGKSVGASRTEPRSLGGKGRT